MNVEMFPEPRKPWKYKVFKCGLEQLMSILNMPIAYQVITLSGIGSESADRFAIALEELQDLKGVWSELARIWEQIDEMKEKPWLSVQPRKVRQQIDGLVTQLKELPAKLRQYASYEHVKRLLQGFAKVIQ